MSSRPRKRPIGYLVAVLVASCAPFAVSTAESGDGGGTGPGEGGVVDGGGASQDGAGPDAPKTDSSAPDAAFYKQDGGFCGTFTDAIDCFDFDEVNPPARLTLAQSGGTNTFEATFGGGSPPTALVTTSTAINGRAIATTIPISFAAHLNKRVTIDFRFSVGTAPTSSEYLGRLLFQSQVTNITLDGTNTLRCGTAAYPTLSPGPHAIAISMAVPSGGSVTMMTCALDTSAAVAVAVQSSRTLELELGNYTSGSGAFSVAYDNVVVREQ